MKIMLITILAFHGLSVSAVLAATLKTSLKTDPTVNGHHIDTIASESAAEATASLQAKQDVARIITDDEAATKESAAAAPVSSRVTSGSVATAPVALHVNQSAESDDDDDDEGDDATQSDNSKACAAQEAHMVEVAGKLAENLRDQEELQKARKEIEASKSNKDVDDMAQLVANQTESAALATMLGHMWKEMRMFESPAFQEYVEKELKHLKGKESELNATMSQAKTDLENCKMGKKQAPKKASPSNEGAEVPTIEDDVVKASKASTWNVWQMSGKQRREAILGSLFYLLGGFLVAYIYKRFLRDAFVPPVQTEELSNSNEFMFGLFSCFSAPKLTVLGCFCPCVMWADTLDRKELLPFWQAFLAFFGLLWLHMYTSGISSLFVIVLGIIYRQKIRSKYQLNKSNNTVLFDIFAWCCCQTCAIIQEAREERSDVKVPLGP